MSPCLLATQSAFSQCVRARERASTANVSFLHAECENQGALASVLVRVPLCFSSGLTRQASQKLH